LGYPLPVSVLHVAGARVVPVGRARWRRRSSRPADAPKGKVDVTVANGVVELRGGIDDGTAERLSSRPPAMSTASATW
jgi:hypothetical protein